MYIYRINRMANEMNYVYLHGFLSGKHSFKGSFFRKKFTEYGLILHIPDLNDGDFEHLTFSSQLNVIEKLVNAFDGDVTLLGSSMGGYLATLFAEQNPRVKQLILIAPAFQFVSRFVAGMNKITLQKWKEAGYIEVYHHDYQENRPLHYGIVEDARQYDRMELQRQLPCLIFHGINDEVVNYQLNIDYLKLHSSAHLVLLNADHQMKNEVEVMWTYLKHFLNIHLE